MACTLREPINCTTTWELLLSDPTAYSIMAHAVATVKADGARVTRLTTYTAPPFATDALNCTNMAATLLVPDNHAWLRFFKDYRVTPEQLWEAPTMLNAILLYHVLPGRITVRVKGVCWLVIPRTHSR